MHRGRRVRGKETESASEQWAAQHFQTGLEVLISWELVSREATVILWGKGDFSQQLWCGESNLVECTESHGSWSCRNHREVGNKSLSRNKECKASRKPSPVGEGLSSRAMNVRLKDTDCLLPALPSKWLMLCFNLLAKSMKLFGLHAPRVGNFVFSCKSQTYNLHIDS